MALLVTPQFFNTQSDYVNKSGWAAAQFMGRIEKYVSLPETLPVADLEKVARAWLPNGDKRSIEVLADFAALSQKYLAAIEHTVKQAIYLARQAGRETPDWTDIKTAVKTGSMPADAALSAAIGRAAAPPRAASSPQPTRATSAERSRIIFFAPIFRRALPATLMLWKSYKTNPDKINVRSTTLI